MGERIAKKDGEGVFGVRGDRGDNLGDCGKNGVAGLDEESSMRTILRLFCLLHCTDTKRKRL